MEKVVGRVTGNRWFFGRKSGIIDAERNLGEYHADIETGY